MSKKALAEPQQDLVAWVDALFDAIKHGDAEHQNWLQEKLKSWVIVNPPSTPPATPVQPVAFEEWHSANYVQTLEKYGDSYKNMHVRNRWQGWLGAKSTPPAAQRPWVDMPELQLMGAYEDEQQGRWGDHVRGLLNVQAKLKELNA
jgi:hypothetical protein